VSHLAAIALGSNLPSQWGGPAGNLHEAVRCLGELGAVRAVSSFFETAPVGYTDQPNFLNAAALLETTLEPEALMQGLLEIERSMGRDRSAAPAKGPRIIDLDLLIMDGFIRATPELTLPHPALADRRFVLAPLAQIAADMVHPVTGNSVIEMLIRLERAT